MTQKNKAERGEIEAEIKWWKSLSQSERDNIWLKKLEAKNKRHIKNVMRNFESYLKSGKRTY